MTISSMPFNSNPSIQVLQDVLGAPFCRGENYIIYNCDCLEAMKSLPEDSIDLTITSPPYNIGKDYEQVISLDAYINWCESWLSNIHQATKPAGAFFLNLGYISIPEVGKAVPLPYLLWNRTKFFLMQEIVWNYGAGVAGRKFLSPRNEKFLWYVKDENVYTFNLDDIRDPDVKYANQKKNGKLRCNTIGKNPSDVWQIAKVTSGEKRSSKERAPHPAQFPRDLIDRIVKGFSNFGDLILDPFMGSGTTAESAILLGRAVIGFEIRTDYCSYIEDRLKRAELSLKDNGKMSHSSKVKNCEGVMDKTSLLFS